MSPIPPNYATALARSCKAEALATLPSDALTSSEWASLIWVARDRSWSCKRAVQKAVQAARANPPRGS